MSRFLQIHPDDNVVVCLEPMTKGDKISFADGREIQAVQDIPAGHKIAVTDIKQGSNVVKYGYAIGHATEDIPTGGWVHTHDTKTNLEGILDYKYEPDKEDIEKKKKQEVRDNILAQISDLDRKRIRALSEPSIKDEITGESWLDYYNSQIVELRKNLAEVENDA